MNKNEDKISFSQEMQLSVKKRRTAFPVDSVDWERLRKMVANFNPVFDVWANVSSAGFSASLAIFLTWLTVTGQDTYPHKAHLFAAVLVTFTVGLMAAVFAWSKKRNEKFSKDQILQEMDIMKIPTTEEVEQLPSLERVDPLTIIRAVYGVQGKDTDVTQTLNNLIVDEKLDVKASNALAGDPAPGTPKYLEIEYEYKGVKSSKRFIENEQVILP